MGTVSGAPKKEMGYEEIFTYRHLYEPYKRCLKGKRGKKEALDFSLNASKNLMSLFYELKYRKYKVGGYNEFVILDPKRRVIQAIPFRDRVVQHCLVDYYLEETMGRSFILDNVACQKGKGTSFAYKRIKLFMREWLHKNGTNGYFVKIDVHKYFESIDHETLKKELSKKVGDEEIRGFLFGIIDSFRKETGKGLPMGNQTSQWFALLYLNGLDHFAKERLRVRFYLRYMDDILLAVGTREQAVEVLKEIGGRLASIKLRLNPKSSYFPIRKGLPLIGWHFYYDGSGKVVMSLAGKTKKKIMESIKGKRRSHELFPYQSYRGFLSQGDTHRFVGLFFSQKKGNPV